MVNSRSRAKHYKMNTKHPVTPHTKKAIKTTGLMVKTLRDQPEKAKNGQNRDTLSIMNFNGTQ